MWWILIALLVVFLFYGIKEPYSGSPYDFVQEQAGEIDSLFNKLQKNTLTESYIDSLQSDNDKTTNQINQLKSNLPS
jgi:hypothetical protein